VDILVNNAAFQRTYDELEEIPDEEWDYTFATNITAMFHLCKAAVPHMKPGSSIINTTRSSPTNPTHAAGLCGHQGRHLQLHRGAGPDAGEKGIRVNAVAPGPIWTPLIPSTMPDEKVKTFGEDTPLKRPGQPRELAGIFVLLASEDGSYMNGGVYPVTGGTPLL
jgi:NAD(P)-dependent dehydrogenase (short-subunit alcohol dehydrogenase family)